MTKRKKAVSKSPRAKKPREAARPKREKQTGHTKALTKKHSAERQASSQASSEQSQQAEALLSKVQLIDIDADLAGQRIDNFLFRQFKSVPKSRIYRALRDGEIRVNKKRTKHAYRLSEGDSLRLPPLRIAEKKVHRCSDQMLEQLERAIIFENKDMIVVNKPSGLAVHGGSGINSGLIEAMRQLRPDCKRLELVHRLDRDTSGCTMIAKKSSVLRFLHQQLREKTMQKHYLALVKGRWPKRKVQVNLALEKNILGGGERMVRPSPEGKPSKTAFAVVESLPLATLVKASPITGRTHQIRVHTQASGHPILGDSKYGVNADKAWEKSLGLQRLFLHAVEIEFRLPDIDEPIHVKAPLPAELEQVLQGLREA